MMLKGIRYALESYLKDVQYVSEGKEEKAITWISDPAKDQ